MIPELLFVASLLIVFIIFVLYGATINLLSKNKKIKTAAYYPKISIIIPTFNEEKNIENKIKNIMGQSYPKNKTEIIVADSCSTDNTRKIVKKFKIKLMEAPPGKIAAINTALEKASSDIVVLTDADAELNKDAIKNCVMRLTKEVGGVTGFPVMKNVKNKNYAKGKISYHRGDWELRYREGVADSCCGMDGKLIVFKKSIVPRIPDNSYTDDFELTLLIRKKGYRCIVEKSAVVYETPPINMIYELKQMRRRTALSILTVARHLDVLFNKKYSLYGMLILPWRRFFVFFLPFFVTYILFFLWNMNNAVFYLLVLAYLALLTASSKMKYATIMLAAITLSWLDIILFRYRKNRSWEKIEQ